VTVVVAYPFTEERSSVFDECLHKLLEADPDVMRLPWMGAAGRIHDIRNGMAAAFLDQSDAEWLWYLDSDMAFAPDTAKLLIQAADPIERPVIGGLCFGQVTSHVDGYGIPHYRLFPTIYKWNDVDKVCSPVDDYPPDSYVRCYATGGACLLVHRSVLVTMRERTGDHWFTPLGGAKGDPQLTFSEDMSFCIRLQGLGVPLYVHTGIKTGHQKARWLTDDMFRADKNLPRERWVVIPSKDRLKELRGLIGQLRDQGEADGIVIVDNGYSRVGRNWLTTQKDLKVLAMDGAGIHEMWNAGIDACPPNADIAVLNDDVTIGPAFLSSLQATLTGHPELAVVSPNYDGREGDQLVYTSDICANRYDGTGGIAGFAFMLSAAFARRYRFPTECKWWYGDNDMVLTANTLGLGCAITLTTTVEHEPSLDVWQTDEMRAQTDADGEAFAAKWRASFVKS
jgi:hypothetical protein